MNTLERVDLKKTLSQLYTASPNKAAVVDVPAMQFLAIDGSGHPAEQTFQQACSAVYPLAYLVKFMLRERLGIDYGVMPMEVNWVLRRSIQTTFTWTLRLMQPEWITAEMVAEARQEARSKVEPALLERVRFETAVEGLCGQMLHRGPYEGMNDTLARMTAQLKALGYSAHSDTHDIYLNDMRKTRPENYRAIMRVSIHPLS